MNLEDFVNESNRIEGLGEATDAEIDAHLALIDLPFLETKDLEEFVRVVAPGNRLRDQYGLDVQVRNHIPPRGCPEIRQSLDTLLDRVAVGATDPWQVHLEYEHLHPFTDGNGRSGRALWRWQMGEAPLGFLHKFYFQTLSGVRQS